MTLFQIQDITTSHGTRLVIHMALIPVYGDEEPLVHVYSCHSVGVGVGVGV